MLSPSNAGKVALVTGAARGIGQAIARRLHKDGFFVAMIDKDSCEETIHQMEKDRGRYIALECDISNIDQLLQTAEQILEQLGGVDVLVNNAGIYPFQPFEDITIADFRKIVSVNLEPLVILSQAFLPRMKQKKWGRIINVASNSLHMAIGGVTHYQATKGGVIGLTRGLAAEFGDSGITVNCISPALTLTPGTASVDMSVHRSVVAMQCIKRHGLPVDYEGIISFLSSDDSSFLTAQEIIVDGGLGR